MATAHLVDQAHDQRVADEPGPAMHGDDRERARAAAPPFDYATAFARNLGLVSEAEQLRLRRARVAIAGLGGVGGAHVQAIARLGIGALNLADLDTFSLANTNRQLGATADTMGEEKALVLERTARAINPGIDARTWREGINPGNIARFLEGVDVVIDGIDYFRIEIRRMLFQACHERRIPVVIAGPLGYGAAIMTIVPGGMSFDEYFNMGDPGRGGDGELTRAEQLLSFALGLSPGLVSDVDPSRVDIAAETGPALVSACLLCAAGAASECLKLLVGRGRLAASPHGVYYDLWRNRTRSLRRRPGLRTWRGRLLRRLAFARFPAFRALHERELLDRRLACT